LNLAIGIDSHKSTLAAAAVDELGRAVSVGVFGNDSEGHRALLEWRRSLEGGVRIGIECSGSYGQPVAGVLIDAGEDVFEVPANLSHREARRQNRGKSDPIDAVAIARVLAREESLPRPRIGGSFEDLRLLSDHYDHLKRLRTQLANRIHKHLMIVSPGYEKKFGSLTAERTRRAVLLRLRSDHSVRAQLVKRNVREIRRLDAEMKQLRAEIADAVAATGTSLTQQCGIGPALAAKVLGEVGDLSNVRSKAAFGRLSGTAPIPASSGKVVRYRLNRGGNRKLNYAIHFVAVTRCRLDPETQASWHANRPRGNPRRKRCDASNDI